MEFRPFENCFSRLACPSFERCSILCQPWRWACAKSSLIIVIVMVNRTEYEMRLTQAGASDERRISNETKIKSGLFRTRNVSKSDG